MPECHVCRQSFMCWPTDKPKPYGGSRCPECKEWTCIDCLDWDDGYQCLGCADPVLCAKTYPAWSAGESFKSAGELKELF